MSIKSFVTRDESIMVSVEMWSNGNTHVLVRRQDTQEILAVLECRPPDLTKNGRGIVAQGMVRELVYGTTEGFFAEVFSLIGKAFAYIDGPKQPLVLGQAVTTTHRAVAEEKRNDPNFAVFAPNSVGIIVKIRQTVPVWKNGPVYALYYVEFMRDHVDAPSEVRQVMMLSSELVETESIPCDQLRAHATATIETTEQ